VGRLCPARADTASCCQSLRHRKEAVEALHVKRAEPGWVPTKMGGPSATGDLHQGCVTQAWLATSEDELARSTGGYFYRQRPRAPNPAAGDVSTQEKLLAACHRISGVLFD